VSSFTEIPGKGIKGNIDGRLILIGSSEFVGIDRASNTASTLVHVSIDESYRGHFKFESTIREGISEILSKLGSRVVALLSGDNDSESVRMRTLFGADANLRFDQSPQDKLEYISSVKSEGKSVMMLGDGLNDSGALKQSDVGIAVTDDTGIFTPACDGILHGDSIRLLPTFLKLAKTSTSIVRLGFIISFLYNAAALAVAASGLLTPLTAAILMPLSSISVVAFSTFAVKLISEQTINASKVEQVQTIETVKPVLLTS
jgi:Cu+-exporting ATPase